MNQQENQTIAIYLAAYADAFQGVKIQSFPPTFAFAVANLPHNEILGDEFWALAQNHEKIVIVENIDGTWRVSV